MPEYLVDEFIGGVDESTFEEQVDKKISLLYDMCILSRSISDAKRVQATHQLLASCQTERQMDNAVHDIVVGKCTLEDVLKRKGIL